MSARGDLFDYLVEHFDATASDDNPDHAITEPDPVTGLSLKLSAAPDGSEPEPLADLILIAQDAYRAGITVGNTLQRSILVFVVSRLNTPGAADDNLETLTEEVLAALDAATFLMWTDAERVAYLDSFPAYKITLTMES